MTDERKDLLIPVAPSRDDDTIAQGILRHVAHMRRHDQLDQSLCWDPQELELLAMFAIDAKNRLKRVDEAAALTHPPTPSGRVTVTEEDAVVADGLFSVRRGKVFGWPWEVVQFPKDAPEYLVSRHKKLTGALASVQQNGGRLSDADLAKVASLLAGRRGA